MSEQHLDAEDYREFEELERQRILQRQKERAAWERARWCEEIGADVTFSEMDQAWSVEWMSDSGLIRDVSRPDRNAAIDAARGAN